MTGNPSCVCGHGLLEHTQFGDCAHRPTVACSKCDGEIVPVPLSDPLRASCWKCGTAGELAPVCACVGFQDLLSTPECQRPDTEPDAWKRCSCEACVQERREQAAERDGHNI